MCGIIGCIGDVSSKDLIYGLNRMEYRGYDSCGISFFKDTQLNVLKSLESPDSLFAFLPEISIGIGHTRWATHGKVCINNAHPILSYNKKISLVHNGVLENYNEIYQEYLKGIPLLTETDTEIIVDLIAFFNETNSLEASLRKTTSILKGSYAFLFLSAESPDRIYYASNNMPLIVGISKHKTCIASDVLAFSPEINKCYYLEDNCCGYISTMNRMQFDYVNLKRGNLGVYKENKHHMLSEIESEITVLDAIVDYLNTNKEIMNRLQNLIHTSNLIVFVGSGSSYNACKIASYLFSKKYACICKTMLASEFIYSDIKEASLYFFVSQSGETADTIKAFRRLTKTTHTVSITNVSTSTLARLASYNLNMCAGPEVGVAATKTFLATILLFYQMSDPKRFDETIPKIRESINKSIAAQQQIKEFAYQFAKDSYVLFLGRGIDYLINNENMLKIKEVDYTYVDNYYGGELKHGPLALCSTETKVFAINTQLATDSILRANIKEANARGSQCYCFSSLENHHDEDFYTFNLSNEESIFECAVFFQLFSFYLAIAKGNNPDRPRNLAKSVTVE